MFKTHIVYTFWMLTITSLSVSSKSRSYDSFAYVMRGFQHMTFCSRYSITQYNLSKIFSRSVVLSRTPVSSSFKRYTWNIVLQSIYKIQRIAHRRMFKTHIVYTFWMLTITSLSVSSKSISNITEKTTNNNIMFRNGKISESQFSVPSSSLRWSN
jgi:hypothetical protein